MSLSTLNYQILQSLNSHPTLDPIMIFLSSMGDYILWLAIFVALYLWKGKRVAFSYAFVVLVATILIFILKLFFEIPRPDDVRFVIEAHGYSMPSGHTSRSFASAMFLHPLVNNGKFRLLIWILAALIGLSRIFVGVHYPSDVLVGALIGCIIGYVGIKMQPYIAKCVD
ncbi:MAG: phosphatase PAP2 family protein [Methanosarcinaceae archaeon]|nr:phosphatase PAP2 family protein [Methanosarcinaceae archaeon]